MSAGRGWVLMAALAAQTMCACAASYRSVYDPVGEQVYSAGLLRRMAPVAILAGAFLLAWLLNKLRNRMATERSL